MNKIIENDKIKVFDEKKMKSDEDEKYKEWFEEMNRKETKKKIKSEVKEQKLEAVCTTDMYMYKMRDNYGSDTKFKFTNVDGFAQGRYYFIQWTGTDKSLSWALPISTVTGNPWKVFSNVWIGVLKFYYANYNVNFIGDVCKISCTNTATTPLDTGGWLKVVSNVLSPESDVLANVCGKVVGNYGSYTYVNYDLDCQTHPDQIRYTEYALTNTAATVTLTLQPPLNSTSLALSTFTNNYYLVLVCKVCI